jgi:hypothetical protein
MGAILVSDLHQQATEVVLAATVSAVAPILVLGIVLYEQALSGGMKPLCQRWVLLKLYADGSAHDVEFRGFPVVAQRFGMLPEPGLGGYSWVV